MLANGKEVNHLIVGGETFDSRKMFPALYNFGTSYVRYYYNIFMVDGKFEINQVIAQAQFNINKPSSPQALVSQIFHYEGEDYALAQCNVETPYEMKMGTVWVKVSEAGGMTHPGGK